MKKSDTDSPILVRYIHSTCSNKQFLGETLWKTSEGYLRNKTKQGMLLRNIATFVLSSLLLTDTSKGWNHNWKKKHFNVVKREVQKIRDDKCKMSMHCPY